MPLPRFGTGTLTVAFGAVGSPIATIDIVRDGEDVGAYGILNVRWQAAAG